MTHFIERHLGSAGCHDCGQRGARAHARARLGDPGRTHGPWPERSPVRAAECGQVSGLIPARNNFLLPRPRAQELRGEVLGRSFAILEPDDDTAAHGPRGSFPRPLPRSRPAGLQGPDTG